MKSKSSIITESNMKTHAPIHPGEVLREDFLIPLGLSEYRVAKDIGVPPRRINEIVMGKRSLTVDTALRLERYFGWPADVWLNLQSHHDQQTAKAAMKSATVSLVWLARHAAPPAKAESVDRRFQRFFASCVLPARTIGALILALSPKPPNGWVLAMDRTNWKFSKESSSRNTGTAPKASSARVSRVSNRCCGGHPCSQASSRISYFMSSGCRYQKILSCSVITREGSLVKAIS